MQPLQGVVVFGDVIASREAPSSVASWLGTLCRSLDDVYRDDRLAAFEFTQGDEIQGLLRPGADPFRAIVSSMLRPADGPDGAPRMRWVAVLGRVDPGRGPATHRTGPAFVRARALLSRARSDHDGLLCETGDAAVDAYLAGTAPMLAAIIERMTDRQRQVARLALVEGLRRSEIAERLDVARPTISVSYARADVRNLSRLIEALRRMWTDGAARVMGS